MIGHAQCAEHQNQSSQNWIKIALVAAILIVATLCACSQSEKTKIDSLKGPTSIGLSQIIKEGNYETNIVAQPDAVVSDLASGKIDIALIPSNLAINLYNKSHNIKCIDINTLGALSALSQNATNLDGRKIYMTGKGAIPELVMKDYDNIEFKSEASEVISYISKDPEAIGIVNEPQATLALYKNPNLKRIKNLSEGIVTGVTVIRTDKLNKAEQFLKDHKMSVEAVKNNPNLAIETGIFENTEHINEAIANCNICFIIGKEMKDTLNAFCDKIGIEKPDNDFYYE